MTGDAGWSAVTWEGSRRAQIRRGLRLSVRERLEALEALTATGERLLGIATGPGLRDGTGPPGRDDAGSARGLLHEIRLGGCCPTPLASYLKALGVLRVVAEQVDPEARGYWSAEAFVLVTALDEEQLVDFFAERYEPTPLLAPWNGGSGFYPSDDVDAIEALKRSQATRLRRFRVAIGQAEAIVRSEGLVSRPEGEAKERVLTRLRAEVDDSVVQWLDAAVLLCGSGPKYPPLLGTGGNDGRLDFTNNFMQHVVGVIDPATGRPRPGGRILLEASLLGRTAPGMVGKAVGQFMPGAGGWPNGGTGFIASAQVNPWDFVLMLEGTLLFAATATRRQAQLGDGRLSYPFTVHTTGSGAGGAAPADESPARAEMWMPLWPRPVGLAELRMLLGEGRATRR